MCDQRVLNHVRTLSVVYFVANIIIVVGLQ